MREIEPLDRVGIEGRREFVSAHYASDVCWRSCRTLARIDVPALFARIDELEARADKSASDKDILAHIAQQVSSDTQWLDRTRTRESDNAWDVLARELLWKSIEQRTWLLNRIREWGGEGGET